MSFCGATDTPVLTSGDEGGDLVHPTGPSNDSNKCNSIKRF